MIKYALPFFIAALTLGQVASAQDAAFPLYTERGDQWQSNPDFENFIGMQFLDLPEGEFLMGGCVEVKNTDERNTATLLTTTLMACRNNTIPDSRATTFEGPQRNVTIEDGLQMGMFEVTIDQYNQFLQKNRRLRTKNYFRTNSQYGQSSDHPAMHISIDDAKAFTDWLNNSKPPEDTGIYRLPSEAEWEYAARAGTQTRYWWGNSINCLKADYGDALCNKAGPSPVGMYPPNPFGLYDMNGNVSEWVSDCWNKDYLSTPKNGDPATEDECVIFLHRGGAWAMEPVFLRNSDRKPSATEFRHDIVGLRLVRDVRR